MLNTTGKKILCSIAVLSFIFLFAFAPTCSAFGLGDIGNALGDAWNWGVSTVSSVANGALNAAKAIGDAVVGALVSFIGAILISMSLAFFTFCYSILQWAISPDFLAVPIISNEFVRGVGLALTIPLANMVVFLSLVAIGLGTALRLDKFDVRKNLLTLLMVALLINFAPLLCGVVIDISNILMNFFLGGGTTGFEMMVKVFNSEAATYAKSWSLGIGNGVAISLIVNTIMIMSFNYTAGGAYLLFAWLFIQRYIALWVLVILSPLMAAFMILPATRSWWEKWLDQFLSWCFIGTIASFYLYLAQQMINLIGQGKLFGNTGQSLGATGTMLVYAVPVILLHYGFFKTMESRAIGSGAVIKFAQNQTKKIERRAVTEPAKMAAKTEVGRKIANTMADADKWGQGKKTPFGWAQRRIGGVVGAAGIKMADKRDELVAEKSKEASKKSGRQISHDLMHGIMTPAEKALLISTLLKDKDEDVQKKGKKAVTDMTTDQVKTFIEALKKEDKMDKADPIFLAASDKRNASGQTIVPEDVGYDRKDQLSPEKQAEFTENNWDNQTERILSDKNNIPKATLEFLKSAAGKTAIHKSWGAEEMSVAAKKFKEPFIDDFNGGVKTFLDMLKTMDQTDPVQAGKLYEQAMYYNTKLPAYTTSTAGQKAGLMDWWDNAPQSLKVKYGEGQKGFKKFMAAKP